MPCSTAPQSWYWRWRERSLFTPPTDNSCLSWDLNPQPRITCPTFYRLGHDCHTVYLVVFYKVAQNFDWQMFLKQSSVFLNMKEAGELSNHITRNSAWEHTSKTDVTSKLCFTNGLPCCSAQAFHLSLSLRCCFCLSPWFCCPIWSPSQIPRSASMETLAHWEVSFLAETSPLYSLWGEKKHYNDLISSRC